jgi:polyisoprenoid-binding protein YceI
MKTIYIKSLALLAIAGSVAGAQTARVSVAPESKLWVEGTSTIHDWTCKATTLDAAIDVDAAAAQLVAAPPKLLKRVLIKVPVKSLKCGHGGMDDNMYKALKAEKDDEATISYIMATFEAAPEVKDSFTLRTTGTLTIAGVAKPVDIEVTATRLPDGTLKAIGTVPLKMTDFGIKPPTAIFGRIKAGDDIRVKFDFTLGPKALAAAIEK